MKKQFHSTMGLNISVFTHLSDDVTQTLCKILLLSKSGFKVGYFFFRLRQCRRMSYASPTTVPSANDIRICHLSIKSLHRSAINLRGIAGSFVGVVVFAGVSGFEL